MDSKSWRAPGRSVRAGPSGRRPAWRAGPAGTGRSAFWRGPRSAAEPGRAGSPRQVPRRSVPGREGRWGRGLRAGSRPGGPGRFSGCAGRRGRAPGRSRGGRFGRAFVRERVRKRRRPVRAGRPGPGPGRDKRRAGGRRAGWSRPFESGDGGGVLPALAFEQAEDQPGGAVVGVLGDAVAIRLDEGVERAAFDVVAVDAVEGRAAAGVLFEQRRNRSMRRSSRASSAAAGSVGARPGRSLPGGALLGPQRCMGAPHSNHRPQARSNPTDFAVWT